MADWIAEHRQALRTRSRLEASAQRWLAEGRRRDLLLPRGKQLEEAKDLAARPQFHLGADIRMLIAASNQRVRQGDYFRLGAVAAFAVIAAIAAIMGLIARQAEGVAERRTHEAEGLMSYMVGDLADKLRPLGRLDLLSGVGEKALSYFGDAKADKLSSSERRNQAKALQTLAEVARAHADPKGAHDALILARGLLDREPESPDLLKDLGANAFWQGQLALDQHKLDEAQAAFEDYRRFAERMMVIEPDNVDAWVELSYAFTNLGTVAKARGDHASAQRDFEKSVLLKRQALEHRPDDRSLRAGLAHSLSWLGSDHEAAGDLQQALDLFKVVSHRVV
jgi:Flp pilus assembly protein TadD